MSRYPELDNSKQKILSIAIEKALTASETKVDLREIQSIIDSNPDLCALKSNFAKAIVIEVIYNKHLSVGYFESSNFLGLLGETLINMCLPEGVMLKDSENVDMRLNDILIEIKSTIRGTVILSEKQVEKFDYLIINKFDKGCSKKGCFYQGSYLLPRKIIQSFSEINKGKTLELDLSKHKWILMYYVKPEDIISFFDLKDKALGIYKIIEKNDNLTETEVRAYIRDNYYGESTDYRTHVVMSSCSSKSQLSSRMEDLFKRCFVNNSHGFEVSEISEIETGPHWYLNYVFTEYICVKQWQEVESELGIEREHSYKSTPDLETFFSQLDFKDFLCEESTSNIVRRVLLGSTPLPTEQYLKS